MNLKFSLFLSIITLIIYSCGKKNDLENIIILKDQSKNLNFRYNGLETWTPSEKEIITSNSLINEAIENYNKKVNLSKNWEMKPKYYYQLVPYISNNGDKKIYVNALCGNFVNNPLPSLTEEKQSKVLWKDEFFNVLDGGTCFWQMNINIKNSNYTDFSINGL